MYFHDKNCMSWILHSHPWCILGTLIRQLQMYFHDKNCISWILHSHPWCILGTLNFNAWMYFWQLFISKDVFMRTLHFHPGRCISEKYVVPCQGVFHGIICIVWYSKQLTHTPLTNTIKCTLIINLETRQCLEHT